MCCCYLYWRISLYSNVKYWRWRFACLALKERGRAESCTSLWNKLWKSVKELFWSVPLGVFSRLANAKVRTFLITKKPFPYFSYKKVDFYQKKAGYTILYIIARRLNRFVIMKINNKNMDVTLLQMAKKEMLYFFLVFILSLMPFPLCKNFPRNTIQPFIYFAIWLFISRLPLNSCACKPFSAEGFVYPRISLFWLSMATL